MGPGRSCRRPGAVDAGAKSLRTTGNASRHRAGRRVRTTIRPNKALTTAQSQVEAAEAQLKTAHDLVSFTEIRADSPGVVTVLGPSAGEVVQAGQMIVRVARKDGRDAVFDAPAQLIRSAPTNPQIVGLADRRPKSHGARPRADGGTAGRPRDPDVRGQSRPDRSPTRHAPRRDRDVRVETESVPHHRDTVDRIDSVNQQPAVWVVDPPDARWRSETSTSCDLIRPTSRSAQGLDAGEIVVTAGVQALASGSKGPPARAGIHERLQSLAVGARKPIARRLHHDHGRPCWRFVLFPSWPRRRSRHSSSRRCSCTPSGRAQASRRPSSRSPSASSANCRKPRNSTFCAASRPQA